jgi:hypothetical protein
MLKFYKIKKRERLRFSINTKNRDTRQLWGELWGGLVFSGFLFFEGLFRGAGGGEVSGGGTHYM